MKWKLTALIAGGLLPALLLLSGCSDASDTAATAPATVSMPQPDEDVAPAADVTLVNNKHCPISGEPVGSMEAGAHVDYNGFRVGLCCTACKDAFLQDAQTTLEKAQADAASGA